MYKVKDLMFIIAETPVHAGSGSELGIVDLPIQRERYTEFPKIESSGLKGCLREAFESYRIFENGQTRLIDCEKIKILQKEFPQISQRWKEKNIKFDEAIFLIFGPEGDEAHAGAITLTDARILLFPVKSLKGVFAWITSPMILERFRKDLELADKSGFNFSNFQSFKNTVPMESEVVITHSNKEKVVLEEITFEIKKEGKTSQLAEWLANKIFPKDQAYSFWKEKLKKDLVILEDDDFIQFVKTSTEVITRTRISNETGTVVPGALWTEEYLPQDAILYSLIMFTSPRVKEEEKKGIFKAENPEKEAERVYEFFKVGLPKVIQIGGNQTIGKGFVRLKLLNE